MRFREELCFKILKNLFQQKTSITYQACFSYDFVNIFMHILAF